jgi:uncharacterized membrane protein
LHDPARGGDDNPRHRCACCAGWQHIRRRSTRYCAKHCATCHTKKPTRESFREAPKNIILESAADLKKHAAVIYAQTVQGKAMPLGNQTDMTEAERAALGQWLKALP